MDEVVVFVTAAGGGAVARYKHDVYSYSWGNWWAAWGLPYILRQCIVTAGVIGGQTEVCLTYCGSV